VTDEQKGKPIIESLPTVEERPEADVVIFDGHCAFCRDQVRRLDRWDRAGRLAYLSLHDPLTAQRFPDLDREQLMQQMYVIDPSGNRHGGASALRYLSRRLPTLWLLAPLLHIPFTLPLWQWLYGLVAKRRYRLSGGDSCKDGVCQI
jgi:predicted DCC family thiol-disulfide oxidoreductase YuxK